MQKSTYVLLLILFSVLLLAGCSCSSCPPPDNTNLTICLHDLNTTAQQRDTYQQQSTHWHTQYDMEVGLYNQCVMDKSETQVRLDACNGNLTQCNIDKGIAEKRLSDFKTISLISIIVSLIFSIALAFFSDFISKHQIAGKVSFVIFIILLIIGFILALHFNLISIG